MPAPYLYYQFPFALEADDLSGNDIPMATDPSGGVSYQQGWTDPYEENLLTNPNALPIPRGQMNWVLYDITNNLQEYQQYGTPQWVTGNTVQYPIFARVYYLGQVYENLVVNNTATPGADSTWRVVSGNVEGVQSGTVIDFAGPIAPSGYLFCDGSAVSRSTYAGLIAAISRTVTTATTTNGSAVVTNLTNAQTTMFGARATPSLAGMAIESANFPPGTTILSVDSNTQVTMSANATASGTANVTIQFFNWGNGDGSTTFNLPDLRTYTTGNQGGSGITVTTTAGTDTISVVGQKIGSQSHLIDAATEMPAHTHTMNTGPTAGSATNIVGFGQTPNTVQTGVNNSTGGSTPMTIVQPTALMNKAIKT